MKDARLFTCVTEDRVSFPHNVVHLKKQILNANTIIFGLGNDQKNHLRFTVFSWINVVVYQSILH